MSNSMLELTLANEKFRLHAPGETHGKLIEVAERVNERIQALHQKGDALSIQRATLMAAFQFAYESSEISEQSGMSLDETRQAARKIQSLIKQIEEKIQSSDT